MTQALLTIVAFGLFAAYMSRSHTHALTHLTDLNAQNIDRLQNFQRVDRDEWARERGDLYAEFTRERERWEIERGTLLNRIKPETAQHVSQAANGETHMPPPIPYDDDDAFQVELETREELAKRLADLELEGAANGHR
jgi:hypothetical protein